MTDILKYKIDTCDSTVTLLSFHPLDKNVLHIDSMCEGEITESVEKRKHLIW